jgi:Domain of unknown function (DUF3362)
VIASAKRPSKRKSTAKNPHQPTPIRILSSRLYSQNIWAEIFGWCFSFLHLALQNGICPRAGARGGGRADLIGNGKQHLIPIFQPTVDGTYVSARGKNSPPLGPA